MSSAEDADDERESLAATPIIDNNCLQFTVFIVLPNDEICTLRDMPSGIKVIDLKGRLELHAGIPSQMYSLIYPDGEELLDDQKLIVRETILHGYILKVHLHENWEALYVAVTHNNIDQVYHSGGVHLKGNIVISATESNRCEGVVRERGAVALFIAAFRGFHRMASMLITVGVNVNSVSLYGRTPLHGAVAKDRVTMAEFLLNKGASPRKSDCYGVIPLELAKQLSSTMCYRKLRLMQLNFRGSVRTSSNKKSHIPINLDIAPDSDRLDTYIQERTHHDGPDTYHQERTHCSRQDTHYNGTSKLSHYSDRTSLPPPSTEYVTMHSSRKHISSSAPNNEYNRLSTREGTLSSLGSATTGKIRQSERNVKWNDTGTEYTYRKQLNFHRNGSPAIEETVKVKPVTLTQPNALLKFSSLARQDSLKKNVVTADSGEPTAGERQLADTHLAHAMKYSTQRLKHFKKLTTSSAGYVLMKDRKKPAIGNRNKTEVSKAFKDWLEKKTEEIEAAGEISTSPENFNETDSEEDKLYEFNKRVRKTNREAAKSASGNRAVKSVTEFGSTQYGDGRNPSADLHLAAYDEWRRKKRGNKADHPKAKTSNDFMLESRLLEEKRQKLLMNAISYEEWMDHTEERKMLIKQILKADRDEMGKLEEERFKYRNRMFSYDLWKEQLHKREEEDNKRREIQRRYDAELMKEKSQFEKSGSATAFEEWLNKKRSTMSQGQENKKVTKMNETKNANSRSIRPDEHAGQKDGEDNPDMANNEWAARKGTDNVRYKHFANEPFEKFKTASVLAT